MLLSLCSVCNLTSLLCLVRMKQKTKFMQSSNEKYGVFCEYFFLLIFWTFVIFIVFHLLASDQFRIEFRLDWCFDFVFIRRWIQEWIYKEFSNKKKNWKWKLGQIFPPLKFQNRPLLPNTSSRVYGVTQIWSRYGIAGGSILNFNISNFIDD